MEGLQKSNFHLLSPPSLVHNYVHIQVLVHLCSHSSPENNDAQITSQHKPAKLLILKTHMLHHLEHEFPMKLFRSIKKKIKLIILHNTNCMVYTVSKLQLMHTKTHPQYTVFSNKISAEKTEAWFKHSDVFTSHLLLQTAVTLQVDYHF